MTTLYQIAHGNQIDELTQLASCITGYTCTCTLGICASLRHAISISSWYINSCMLNNSYVPFLRDLQMYMYSVHVATILYCLTYNVAANTTQYPTELTYEQLCFSMKDTCTCTCRYFSLTIQIIVLICVVIVLSTTCMLHIHIHYMYTCVNSSSTC